MNMGLSLPPTRNFWRRTQLLTIPVICFVRTIQFSPKRLEGLMARYVDLVIAYASLNRSYVLLLQNYTVLQATHSSLLQNYTALQRQVQDAELQSRYETLLKECQTLQEKYSALKADYEAAYFALYSPLWSNETIMPTLSELKRWLLEDETDKIKYSMWDFVCGDYATMLHMHAKMKRWDVGIVAVLGHDVYGNRFDHTFNAIRCVEGLVYIEPKMTKYSTGQYTKILGIITLALE